MINKNNYESWFLDYYEGTLPAEQVAELFLFLEQHPHLKEEFDAFENIKLTDDLTEVFPAKDFLKKTVVDESNVQQFLIAELEGDLNADELKALHDFIATHKQFETDKMLYAKTKLADDATLFPNKEELKKTPLVDANIEQFLIAELEGDITTAEQKQLNEIVAAQPELQHDRKLYSKTKVTADASIKYPNKGELKKTVSLFGNRSLIYTISIAASILLFLGFYFYTNQEINPKGDGAIAEVDFKDSSNKIVSPLFGRGAGGEVENSIDSASQKEEQVVPGEVVKTPSSKSFAEEKSSVKHTDNRSPLQGRGAGGEAKTPEQNVVQQTPQNKQHELKTNIPEENTVAQNNSPLPGSGGGGEATTSEPKTTIIIQQASEVAQPTLANAVTTLASEKFAELANTEFFDSKSKNKKLKALTWAVNKIGGKKVKIQTEYDAGDKVAAVNVTGRGFSIEHSNGF